jgi:hypothetical protein
MKRHVYILICLLFLSLPAWAQSSGDSGPVYLLNGGEIWQMQDGTPVRLTDFETVNHVSLSPDGTRIAFTAFADMTENAIRESGGYGGGVLPNDLWMLDLITGRLTLIDGQPENALFPPQQPNQMIGVGHSKAAWSPDGCCLAWGEEYHHPDDYQLWQVVYNLSTGERRIITTLEEQYGIPSPIDMLWGTPGLLIYDMQHDGTRVIAKLLVYGPTGELLNEIALDDDRMIDYDWIVDNGQTVISVRYAGSYQWTRIDPLTGETSAIPYPVEFYSPLDPVRSIGIIPSESVEHEWLVSGYHQAEPASFEFTSRYAFTISPDGRSVLFKLEDGGPEPYRAQTLENDEPQSLTIPSRAYEVKWGPMERRVRYPAEIAEPGPRDCAGSEVFRLTVGERGRVMPGDPNTVRATPGLNSSRIGSLPAGTEFEVISGPDCVDNYTWWRVRSGTLIGWTAEGDSSGYWLEPVDE